MLFGPGEYGSLLVTFFPFFFLFSFFMVAKINQAKRLVRQIVSPLFP